MILTNLIMAIIFGVTTIVFILLTRYVWKSREAPGGFYFALLMADGAVFALFNSLQMLATDMQMQILLAKLSYLGIVPAPVLWVLFNIAYSQRNTRLGKVHLLFWIIPAIVLVLVFTNEWHHLFWTNIAPISDLIGSPLVYEYGIGMWLNIIYSYSLMTIGVLLLFFTSMRTYKRYFRQTVTLVLGAMIPFIGNIIYFIWLNKYAAFDPTSITIAITGLIYAWSMFRYRLFDLVPLARDKLITDMAEGILVLDNRDRIIDINPAALQITGMKAAIGQHVEPVLEHRKDLLKCILGIKSGSKEVRLDRQSGDLWLDVRISPLRDNSGIVTGRLIIMHDITDRKKIEESFQQMKILVDKASDMVFLLQSDARVAYVNDAACKTLGYTREEILEMKMFDFNQDHSAANWAVHWELVRQQGSLIFQNQFRTRDNRLIPVEISANFIQFGDTEYNYSFIRDITERERAQQALRKSEADLARAQQIAHLGSWEIDLKTGAIVASDETFRIFGGVPINSITLDNLLSFIHPNDIPGFMKSFDGARSERKGQGIDFRILRKDGVQRVLHGEGQLVYDAGGHIDGAFGTVQDITDRKRIEDALKESEEKFRVLAETTTGAIFILQDEHFVYANPAARVLTGYSLEDLTSMMFPDLVSQEYREFLNGRSLAHMRSEAMSGTSEVKFIDSTNAEKWAEINGGVIEYNNRQALMITAFEITGRKNAESSLLASLREKEVMLKEIHHRVKNNLQIIISLQNLQLSTEARPDVVSIFRESQDRIMAMAMVHEKIYQSPDLSRVNFSDYVQSLTGHLRRAYVKNPGIRLHHDLELLFTSIDQSIPCGLIINELVTNSLKYAFPDGREGNVFVGFSLDAGKYILTVGDDGVGLPAGLDWQSSPSLGLQLVTTLVGQIEGTIELDASKGTVYRITFAEIKAQ